MPLRRVLLLLILSLLSSMALTVAGLLYVQHVIMMDANYIKYGFPYWWLVHVSVTIAGPTDIWGFETSNLVKDFVFFFLLSLGFWILVFLLKQRMTPKTKRESSAR